MLKLLFFAASVCHAKTAGERQVDRILATDPSSGYTAKRGKLTPLGSKFLQFLLIYTSPLASIFQFAISVKHYMAFPTTKPAAGTPPSGAPTPSKNENTITYVLEFVGSGSSLLGGLSGAIAFIHALATSGRKFHGVIGATVNLLLVYTSILGQVIGTGCSLAHSILHFEMFKSASTGTTGTGGSSTPADEPVILKHEAPAAAAGGAAATGMSQKTWSLLAFGLNAGLFWLTYLPYVLHWHWHGGFGLFTVEYKSGKGYTRADCGRSWIPCLVHLGSQSMGDYGISLGSKSVTIALNEVLEIMTLNPDLRNYMVQMALKFLENSKQEKKNPDGNRTLARGGEEEIEAAVAVKLEMR